MDCCFFNSWWWFIKVSFEKMKISFSKIILIISIIFIIVIFFLALNKDNKYTTKDLVGKEVSDFEIKFLLKDETFSKKNLIENKYYLINIWASWCLPCKIEHPLLMKLSKMNNLKLIGINYKDKKSNANNFLNKLGNPYDILLEDNSGVNSIVFAVFGVPETILINDKKIIIKKFIGPINANDLQLIKDKINEN